MVETCPRALTIAGSDSGGGAGIQADLKVFSILGVYGCSAITALTAQNTQGIRAIHEVPPEFVTLQIDAVLEDIGADAIKIGMLLNSRIVTAVADRLQKHRARNIVVDPVRLSKTGAHLLEHQALETLKHELAPLACLLTPNLDEAAELLEARISTLAEMEEGAKALLRFGSQAVLVKGGHLLRSSSLKRHSQSPDCLAFKNDAGQIEVHWFEGERIDTPNLHGTGCTFSSAITAGLAQGRGLVESVRLAKVYHSDRLKAGRGRSLGSGVGPVESLPSCVGFLPQLNPSTAPHGTPDDRQ